MGSAARFPAQCRAGAVAPAAVEGPPLARRHLRLGPHQANAKRTDGRLQRWGVRSRWELLFEDWLARPAHQHLPGAAFEEVDPDLDELHLLGEEVHPACRVRLMVTR